MAEPQTDHLTPGRPFGEFEVVRRLGRGGMGVVYLVRHPVGGEFAVKIVDPEKAGKDAEFVRRFAREGRFAMKTRHRNLIAVHDIGQDPATGLYYLVMDYVPGGDVAQRLAAEGRFSVETAVRIVAQIADALEAAHARGVVHRDLKPANIMFAADGTPKLADLGVAKFEDGVQTTMLTGTHMMIGTPAYMAPEQMTDSHGVDARADVYSLGIVLFEMLTGRRPNEGLSVLEIVSRALQGRAIPDVRTFRADVPDAVADLLNGMCAPKREERLTTAQVITQASRLLDRPHDGEAIPLKAATIPACSVAAPAPVTPTPTPSIALSHGPRLLVTPRPPVRKVLKVSPPSRAEVPAAPRTKAPAPPRRRARPAVLRLSLLLALAAACAGSFALAFRLTRGAASPRPDAAALEGRVADLRKAVDAAEAEARRLAQADKRDELLLAERTGDLRRQEEKLADLRGRTETTRRAAEGFRREEKRLAAEANGLERALAACRGAATSGRGDLERARLLRAAAAQARQEAERQEKSLHAVTVEARLPDGAVATNTVFEYAGGRHEAPRGELVMRLLTTDRTNAAPVVARCRAAGVVYEGRLDRAASRGGVQRLVLSPVQTSSEPVWSLTPAPPPPVTPDPIRELLENMIPIPGRNFALARTEVTQRQWAAVPFKEPWPPSSFCKFLGGDLPVQNLTKNECDRFIKALNGHPLVRRRGVTFRLPTVEEWVYACRAGGGGDYGLKADGTPMTREDFWHKDNSEARVHPVAKKAANAYGLHDMHGNVSEWVQTEGMVALWGLVDDFAPRAYGGAFDDWASACRCTDYQQRSSDWWTVARGLRLARDLKEGEAVR